jgi:hypothetical protein
LYHSARAAADAVEEWGEVIVKIMAILGMCRGVRAHFFSPEHMETHYMHRVLTHFGNLQMFYQIHTDLLLNVLKMKGGVFSKTHEISKPYHFVSLVLPKTTENVFGTREKPVFSVNWKFSKFW